MDAVLLRQARIIKYLGINCNYSNLCEVLVKKVMLVYLYSKTTWFQECIVKVTLTIHPHKKQSGAITMAAMIGVAG